jgi:hypothetical protein
MAMSLMRRLRGVASTMGVWALVFSAVGVAGMVPLSLFRMLPPLQSSAFLRTLAETIFRWGLGGAAMGFAFATAVLLGERRRALDALSPLRFKIWGFIAGALVPLGGAMIYELTGNSSAAINLRAGVIFAGICGAAGAALAAASLRAARRAPTSLDETARVRVPVI